MSGSLPTSPPTSPVAKEVSPPSSQSGNLFRWLLGLGLGGYASALESNGFDNLTFLVRSKGLIVIQFLYSCASSSWYHTMCQLVIAGESGNEVVSLLSSVYMYHSGSLVVFWVVFGFV